MNSKDRCEDLATCNGYWKITAKDLHGLKKRIVASKPEWFNGMNSVRKAQIVGCLLYATEAGPKVILTIDDSSTKLIDCVIYKSRLKFDPDPIYGTCLKVNGTVSECYGQKQLIVDSVVVVPDIDAEVKEWEDIIEWRKKYWDRSGSEETTQDATIQHSLSLLRETKDMIEMDCKNDTASSTRRGYSGKRRVPQDSRSRDASNIIHSNESSNQFSTAKGQGYSGKRRVPATPRPASTYLQETSCTTHMQLKPNDQVENSGQAVVTREEGTKMGVGGLGKLKPQYSGKRRKL
ncbi:hypothetical protein BJ508DRAFT_314232 [Ascobolus immersus RN42]|uniref:CST complex subunit Stn1 N-terminal domain-containing protein n=1 Tax=Ascobolus immersus RN42 TaxID=1160509 RepID=A0A3N4HFP8_ASCIM|nr:hypothetical protein BJ508DRAFT_314232 [Ascobolus immersus RN42]